jgi:hypothetical protein
MRETNDARAHRALETTVSTRDRAPSVVVREAMTLTVLDVPDRARDESRRRARGGDARRDAMR